MSDTCTDNSLPFRGGSLKKTLIFLASMFILVVQPTHGQSCTSDGTTPFTSTVVNAPTDLYVDLGVNALGVLWGIGDHGVHLILNAGQTLPTPAALPSGETTLHGKIAAAPDNSAWVVTDSNHIYHLNLPAGSWTRFPGLAYDISVNSSGVPWVIGTYSVGGGYGIYYWTGTAWQSVQGGAIRIAFPTGGPNDNGQPWVVNNHNQIFHRNPDGSWTGYPGLAIDIGLDSVTGLPWVVGTYECPCLQGYIIYLWTVANGWITDPNLHYPAGHAITGGVPGSCSRTAYYVDQFNGIALLQASRTP
jgi:hypothetical protein